jgi:hypothetical protein
MDKVVKLEEVLRLTNEAYANHMRAQGNHTNQKPWSSWFAAYMVEKFSDLFHLHVEDEMAGAEGTEVYTAGPAEGYE